MLSVITIGIAFLVFLIQSIIHRNERRDLYNRLMARDYGEYRYNEDKEPNKKTVKSNNPFYKDIEKAYNGMHGNGTE